MYILVLPVELVGKIMESNLKLAGSVIMGFKMLEAGVLMVISLVALR